MTGPPPGLLYLMTGDRPGVVRLTIGERVVVVAVATPPTGHPDAAWEWLISFLTQKELI